jgi:hypothetical protein
MRRIRRHYHAAMAMQFVILDLLIHLGVLGATFCVISYTAQRLGSNRAKAALGLARRFTVLVGLAILFSSVVAIAEYKNPPTDVLGWFGKLARDSGGMTNPP